MLKVRYLMGIVCQGFVIQVFRGLFRIVGVSFVQFKIALVF
jgi:hypothetical protein